MPVHLGGGPPAWRKAMYTGGGVEGIVAALRFLEDFSHWREIPDLHVKLYVDAALDATSFTTTTAWTLELLQPQHHSLGLVDAPPPRAKDHLCVAYSWASRDHQTIQVVITGNSYPISAELAALELTGAEHGRRLCAPKRPAALAKRPSRGPHQVPE